MRLSMLGVSVGVMRQGISRALARRVAMSWKERPRVLPSRW